MARRPVPQPPPSERVATGGVAQSRVQRCRDVLVPGTGPGRRSRGGLLGGWLGRGQGTLGAPRGWNRPRLLLGKQLAPLPPSSPRPICAIASHPLIPAPEEARPCPPLACPHPPPPGAWLRAGGSRSPLPGQHRPLRRSLLPDGARGSPQGWEWVGPGEAGRSDRQSCHLGSCVDSCLGRKAQAGGSHVTVRRRSAAAGPDLGSLASRSRRRVCGLGDSPGHSVLTSQA